MLTLSLAAACERGTADVVPASVTPSVSPTAAPTIQPRPTIPESSRTAAPTDVTVEALRSILKSLPTEPQQTRADRVTLPERISPFSPRDPETVVLYDILEGTESDLGPGMAGKFNSSATAMAWVRREGGRPVELLVLDLAAREVRSLGPASDFAWANDDTLRVRPQIGSANSDLFVIDAETGSPVPDMPHAPQTSSQEQRFSLDFDDCQFQSCTRRVHRITDASGARDALEFEAYRAILAADGALFVAMPPDAAADTINIFAVDLITGASTFVATTDPTASFTALAWPFDATTDFLLWVDDHCGSITERGGAGPAQVNLLDRRTNRIVQFEVEAAVNVFFTPDGLIASGPKGIIDLIDPRTLEYVAALPSPVSTTNWSHDYRYASAGLSDGTGGFCG